MGSAILYDDMLVNKALRRGDLGTMCAAMWSAAAGAPVPNASKVGGSVVVHESDWTWPIAVSRPTEVDLTSPPLDTQCESFVSLPLNVLRLRGNVVNVQTTGCR
jgi:hypothetical protein